MDKTTSVAVAVLATIVVCFFLFRQRDDKPEIGRYAWGHDGLTVLDTTDGTIYWVDKVDGDDVSVLQIHAPSGFSWRSKRK